MISGPGGTDLADVAKPLNGFFGRDVRRGDARSRRRVKAEAKSQFGWEVVLDEHTFLPLLTITPENLRF